MNKNLAHNIDFVLDKLISFSIYALFIIPFLIPYSYFPVSKFYAEISALSISLIIMVLSVFKAKRLSIASAGIACLLFAGFLLLQILVIPIRIPGINIAVAVEFCVVALLSIGITTLVDGDEILQEKLIITVAWAVLIGVTIQALYGFLQYTGQAENYRSLILVGGTAGSNIFGNIGQKNDYADFISMGIFALAYLFFIRKINLPIFIIYAIFFGFIITVNTSRTSFTYFILALIASLVFVWINRKCSEKNAGNKRVLIILACIFLGLLILEAIFPKLVAMFSSTVAAAPLSADTTSGLYRFGENSIGQSTYRRFYEWYKDLVIFIQHPIFGIGWYQYPREAIYLMNTERFMYIPANSALYTHSHNSPLNILAETGIIGFLITMVYGFGYSLYRIFKDFNNHAGLFLSFMILTIFAQSCFQYPLWYAYFLVYFVLFLSVNKPIFYINNNSAFKGVALLLFVGIISYFGISTQTYERMVQYAVVPQDMDDYAYNVAQLEQFVDSNSVWSFPALMALDNYILPTSPMTNQVIPVLDQMRYIDKMANQLPYPGAIFKQIIIHKIVEGDAGALPYANLLAHGFPHFKDQFASQLQASPEFSKEVSAIYNFQYEDRSIFAKKQPENDKK